MAQHTEMLIRMGLVETPMEPNEHGLFTVEQVAVLATKRGCVVPRSQRPQHRHSVSSQADRPDHGDRQRALVRRSTSSAAVAKQPASRITRSTTATRRSRIPVA